MRTPIRITVLNTPCIVTDQQSLALDLDQWCLDPSPRPVLSVDFTNVHIVDLRATNTEFHRATESVDWFVSDSQILTWAMTLLGRRKCQRIYGPDFMRYYFCGDHKQITHYLLGGSQHCLELLRGKLRELCPAVEIVGSQNGYFSLDEEARIVADINRVQPDMLWVGLGTPKQQQWIAKYKSTLKCKVVLAVGFAFDVNSGTKTDAPRWLGPIGLTWLYRLVKEPRRLWRRYFVHNTSFLSRILMQMLRRADQ